MSAISLSETVYQRTEDRFLPARMWSAIKENESCLIGGTVFITTTAATVSSVALIYFCMEGTVRSVIAAKGAHASLERLRPLGDAGGWSSLSLGTFLALKGFLEQLVREKEYNDLRSLGLKWIKENQNLEDPNFNQLILEFDGILDAFSSKCLFSKSLVSRRLIPLDILEETGLIKQDSELAALKAVCHKINSKLEEKTSYGRYFHRVYEGFQSQRSKGCFYKTAAVAYGVVAPCILFASAAVSLVGEVGLGNQLYVNRTDLGDVGHFGEWPLNLLGSLAGGCVYHSWHLLAEGDFAIIKKIYGRGIEKLKNNLLHNGLCEIANAELSERASQCGSLKLGYKFKLLK